MTSTHPTKTHLPPLEIAPDTFVIQDHQGEGVEPVVVHLNAMLIRGAQPAVVDTGAPSNRRGFLDDLFSLVDPDDVRWVFLSHDDVDHYGNVEAVMDLCPQAVLVTNWFTMQRLQCDGFGVPPHRWRWLGDGEPLDAGDRLLVPTRPPLYDSPTSLGLYDTRSGVYWGADCFAAPVVRPTASADELPAGVWADGFVQFQQWNSPWVGDLDRRRWAEIVDDFAALDVRAVASCHGPALTGDRIGAAIDLLRSLPDRPWAEQPGQQVLDLILAAMALGPA